MKKILFILAVLLSINFYLNAQEKVAPMPLASTIKPYRLEVGYNFNTAIAFPATIKKAYWGYKDLMALQIPDVGNILLVKAGARNFQPTNLHVFTADGQLFVFQVLYNEEPVRTTYDFRGMEKDTVLGAIQHIPFTDELMPVVQMEELVQHAKQSRAFFRRFRNNYDMHLHLKGIYFKDELLFFSFHLSNNSNLDYDVDFMHLYIQDKHKSKRSSFQQQELTTIQKEDFSRIWGHASRDFVIVVPKFTIPDGKEVLFELFERNGGRHLSLRIKNRHLFNAKPL